MASTADQLRLFIAVYPPAEVVRALLEGIGRLELPEHRVVPAEQVHLTLHFVGSVDASELDSIVETIERSRQGISGFVLRPDRLITLPERGRRRLVAAEADAPAPLVELHRRLVSRLAAKPRDRDHFRPHLTLCRFKRPTAMTVVHEPVEAGTFEVVEIALVKSVLTPSGALHSRVEGFVLDG